MIDDYYVYLLFDFAGIPRYIGKGRGRRWIKHGCPSDTRNRQKKAILARTMAILGEIPVVKICEGLTEAEAHSLERVLIKTIGRGKAGPLANWTDGGEGSSGYRHSPESIERMKAQKRAAAAKMTAADHATVSARTSKAMQDPELRNRLSEATRAYMSNPENARMATEGIRAWFADPLNRAIFGVTQKARKGKDSPETILKKSISHLGKRHTEATRALCSRARFDRYNIAGQRFGRLIVSERWRQRERRRGFEWLCYCDCGGEKWVQASRLRANTKPTRSCGCLHFEAASRNIRRRWHRG